MFVMPVMSKMKLYNYLFYIASAMIIVGIGAYAGLHLIYDLTYKAPFKSEIQVCPPDRSEELSRLQDENYKLAQLVKKGIEGLKQCLKTKI